jgi:hypothetical protein
MLAFEVWIDGQRQCLAGVEDWAILSAHVTASRSRDQGTSPQDDLEFYVGGMTGDDETGASHHFRWKRRNLAVGMQVTIQIVEVDRADDPIRRYRSDRQVQEDPLTDEEIEEIERAEWLRLKARFEPENGSS